MVNPVAQGIYTSRFSAPSPKSPGDREGSDDIGTISWLNRRVKLCQYAHAMQNHRTKFSLANTKPSANIVRSLLCNQMQGQMKKKVYNLLLGN